MYCDIRNPKRKFCALKLMHRGAGTITVGGLSTVSIPMGSKSICFSASFLRYHVFSHNFADRKAVAFNS